MMYIHYCKYCRRIHILNGHKVYCPACSGKLTELGISYMKYVNLSKEERGQLKENNHACQNTAHACEFPFRNFFREEKPAEQKDKHIAKGFNHRTIHKGKAPKAADIQYGRTYKQYISADYIGIQIFADKGAVLSAGGFF